MSKRVLCFALSILLFAFCPFAQAQQQAKLPKIGWLGMGGAGTGRDLFGRELRTLGYVEGKNISIDYRYADKIDRLPALADELIRLKVDVIVMPATSAALAAKNATRTVPHCIFRCG